MCHEKRRIFVHLGAIARDSASFAGPVPVKYSELPAIVYIFRPQVQVSLRGVTRQSDVDCYDDQVDSLSQFLTWASAQRRRLTRLAAAPILTEPS